jgi:hypothetical protein
MYIKNKEQELISQKISFSWVGSTNELFLNGFIFSKNQRKSTRFGSLSF